MLKIWLSNSFDSLFPSCSFYFFTQMTELTVFENVVHTRVIEYIVNDDSVKKYFKAVLGNAKTVNRLDERSRALCKL